MNSISKNKILFWAVILLMIANTAVLVVLWRSHHRQGENRGTPAEYLIKELALNNDQQQKLKALADQHHQESERIRGQIKDARDSLFGLLQQANVSDSIKNAAANNVARNLAELDLLTFNHFQQVRAICTSEQQKKFDEIIQDVLRMFAAGPPRGVRPPPPQNSFNHHPPEEGDDQMPPPPNH